MVPSFDFQDIPEYLLGMSGSRPLSQHLLNELNYKNPFTLLLLFS